MANLNFHIEYVSGNIFEFSKSKISLKIFLNFSLLSLYFSLINLLEISKIAAMSSLILSLPHKSSSSPTFKSERSSNK
jgi:hypothetical protein